MAEDEDLEIMRPRAATGDEETCEHPDHEVQEGQHRPILRCGLIANPGFRPPRVRRYVDERDLPWTVLIDPDGAAVNGYGAIGTPTHYLVDGSGTIDSRAFGRLRYVAMARRN